MTQVPLSKLKSNLSTYIEPVLGHTPQWANKDNIDLIIRNISLSSLVIFLLVVLLIIRQKRRKNAELIIEHSDTEDGFYQSSLVIPKDMFPSLGTENILAWRLCRIRIHNTSSMKINNIQVYIKISDHDRLKDEGYLHLLSKDDKEKPHQRSVDLAADDEMFFNVVNWERIAQSSQFDYYIPISEDNIHTRLGAETRDYNIRVRVTGDGILKIERDFSFGIRNKDNTFDKVWLWPKGKEAGPSSKNGSERKYGGREK